MRLLIDPHADVEVPHRLRRVEREASLPGHAHGQVAGPVLVRRHAHAVAEAQVDLVDTDSADVRHLVATGQADLFDPASEFD